MKKIDTSQPLTVECWGCPRQITIEAGADGIDCPYCGAQNLRPEFFDEDTLNQLDVF
jgi:predicted RNA-binding Zn-ribbon protein involved in translation (DUF1610 family)